MSVHDTSIRQAIVADLAEVAPLFGRYLAFYQRTHAESRVLGYLQERIGRGESVVYVAERESEIVGFAQCYPTWSSLDLAPIWVLEDLFVEAAARRSGVARSLIDAVVRAARAGGNGRLVLETQHHNASAIALYEALGFGRDEEFATYALELTPLP